MPKVLTVMPTEGESPEDFAARVASEAESFFGGEPTDAEEAPAEETETPPEEPTDETAEPEAAPEEEPEEG
jgi:hypothetical protein